MPALRDLSGFVEAAVLEEAQLFNPEEESEPAMQVMQVGSAQYLTDQGRAGNTRDRLASRQRLSKRQVSFMSPRLGLLNNLPMAVPFVVRLKVFDQLVK
jgi:ubiquitin-protein ligase E3 C